MTTEYMECGCDKPAVQARIDGRPRRVRMPHCYVMTDDGVRIDGSFVYRLQVEGECDPCHDRYMKDAIADQFNLAQETVVFPDAPPKPVYRWLHSPTDGWHILKTAAEHAAGTHKTECRKAISPVGVTYSDDAPTHKEDIGCDTCKSKLED